ncbi:Y4yA family PLP-dependent enzyme [Algoriphagus aquimarinus]|uniref:Y4yA family PLP-dependent enzyme n=1 Tax=Algoriphagus aquimarinus TaxID=237018 RepID=UPI0030DD74A2
MMQIPRLSPITSPWMRRLMQDKPTIDELLVNYGSPINIHNPDSMEDNYKAYQEVFEEFKLDYQVFFARKANKTKGVVRKAAALGVGIDTASLQEYAQCLELGLHPDKIIVTAAIKNKDLIKLAVSNGSLLILDNEDECKLVQKVALELGKSANVGFRVSGFTVDDKKLYSRFGLDADDFELFINENFLQSERFNQLTYRGLHFHLNGYSIKERGNALNQCLSLAEFLKKNGLTTEFIDIGGGLLMNYLESESEWDKFHYQLRKAISSKTAPITYGNNGLGIEIWNGLIRGELKTYPFWNANSKGDFLRGILSYKNLSGEKVGDLAREMGVEIRMEPGRSMLDQVGMTVAKVAFRKMDSSGDWLVGLEMNMTQMLSGSADFLLDPYVVYQDDTKTEDSVGVYFTGAYCLERDVLLKRKINLDKLPEVGDVVFFVNTAGYMMHFFESSAHLFPLAENLMLKEYPTEKIDSSSFLKDQ